MDSAVTELGTSISRRRAADIMTLSRMGSFHQTRLSFMRVLLRRIRSENWKFSKNIFDINSNGVGRAVYSVNTGKNSYSLIIFANDLPAEKRSDRVIATEWDATFTLFDGLPTQRDIDRLERNIPLQEEGRVCLLYTSPSPRDA